MNKRVHWTGACMVLFYISALSALSAHAQGLEPAPGPQLEEALVEDLELMTAGLEENEPDYSEIIRHLNTLRDDPLNINGVEREDADLLLVLSDMQLFNLLAYRASYGELASIYELQAIDGFDPETIRRIIPFVKIEPVPEDQRIRTKNVMSYGKHRLLFRVQRVLESRAGYERADDLLDPSAGSHYLGSPERILLRYGFSYRNRIRLGFSAEKDPGEIFFINGIPDSIRSRLPGKTRAGFDFYSLYFAYSGTGILKNLVVGDYQLQFGQGLTVSSGQSFGPAGGGIEFRPVLEGIKPHSGADENRFLRGGAITLKWQNLNTHFFYSCNGVDARLDFDSLSDAGLISNQPVFTGYHRTLNELMKKNSMHVQVAGTRLSYSGERFKVGFTAAGTNFEHPVAGNNQLYGKYSFSGSEQFNAGFDYHFLVRGISFFGEVSSGAKNSMAMVHGLYAVVHPRLSCSLLFRDSRHGYQNYFSHAFASGRSYNEKGFFAGIKFTLAGGIDVVSSLDSYRRPWVSYSTDRPSIGKDAMVMVNIRTGKNLSFVLRFRQSDRQRNERERLGALNPLLDTRKSGFRVQADQILTPALSMRNRIEWVKTAGEKPSVHAGFLVFHDIRWKNKNENVTVNLRYALFDTDTYEERIYAYEQDVLYAFSVPAYYGRGARGAGMLTLKAGRSIGIWLRLSRTWYSDRQYTGSGADEIRGNAVTEIKLQLQLKIR